MRKLYVLIATAGLIIGSNAAKAQLYNYTNDLGGAATTAANTTGTGLERVNGTVLAEACADGFNSVKFSEGTFYTDSRPSIQFSITPDAGYQLNVTNISADVRISPKGPDVWRIAYSTDGGATWTNNGSDIVVVSGNCFTTNNISFDVTDFSTTSTVWVRLVGYSAFSSTNGKATLRNVVLGGDVAEVDLDGDGYGGGSDCDDTNPDINPGATEICNGIDDNCNGDTDEGLEFTTWYADMDGDGYGDAAMSTETCDGAPAGYVADATDCNDADAAINPGATEICNGMDDNCNGDIDEGLEFTTWYADMDGDGYGDAAMSTETCDGAPAGYVADATDCNDADAAVNPGATEVCNGIDDNCDGNIDEGVMATWYADADGDAYGDAAMSTMACDAPEGYVADATDCNDADATVNPGATEVCGNGVDDNCDGNIDEADVAASFDVIGDNPTCEGLGTYFQSTATGMDISYQWYRNLAPIAGATDATYTPGNTGYYQLEVSNGICSAITDTTYVIIKKAPEPSIYAELGLDVCVNGYVKLKAIPSPGTGSTYVWYFNGDVLAGATTELVETSDAGDYYCVVTGPNGCSGTSETVSVTADCRLGATGAAVFTAYPNPAANTFTIDLSNAALSGEAMISVMDITGRVVYTNNAVINNGNLIAEVALGADVVNGVYMVAVQSGAQSFNTQIVINK